MSELPKYVYERRFDAPRELVWRTWSDPVLLARWYGPGVETIIHRFDLQPGGVWLNEMKWGGNSDFSKMTFQEVVTSEKLVWHHCSTDAKWNEGPSAMMPDWPRKMLATAEFIDLDGKATNLRLTMIPIDATQAEIDCFAAGMGGMSKGWGSGFNIIEEILGELQV